MKVVDKIALVLIIIGAINWGLVGFFKFNLVDTIFGSMSVISRIIYALVGISGLWGIKLLFDDKQDVHAGGSGCGCAASVLCAHLLPRLADGTWQRIILAATGALMSPTSVQQGESIPGICHAIVLESGKKR